MSNKLSKSTIKLLNNVLATASMLGVERAVIDSHSIRGSTEDNETFMLLKFDSDVELEFGAMGIGRIGALKKRLNVLKDSPDILVEYKSRDSGDKFVFRLQMKKGRTTVDFKCTDPTQIKAPKNYHDAPAFSFSVTAEDIKLMLSSKSAIGAENVMFRSTDGETVEFLMSGDEGDAFTHILESPLDKKTDTEEFCVTYKNKILFPVLKEVSDAAKEADVEIIINERGSLVIDVNGIPVYVLAEI